MSSKKKKKRAQGAKVICAILFLFLSTLLARWKVKPCASLFVVLRSPLRHSNAFFYFRVWLARCAFVYEAYVSYLSCLGSDCSVLGFGSFRAWRSLDPAFIYLQLSMRSISYFFILVQVSPRTFVFFLLPQSSSGSFSFSTPRPWPVHIGTPSTVFVLFAFFLIAELLSHSLNHFIISGGVTRSGLSYFNKNNEIWRSQGVFKEFGTVFLGPVY